MSNVIATIMEIEGEVLAQNIAGELRLLDAGDKLYEGETIKTGSNGFVVLQLNSEDLVTIQGNQLIELNENVLADKVADQTDSIQQQSIEDVLAILEAGGDLTEQLEAPAAGIAGPGDAGGAMTLRLLSLAESEGAEYEEAGGVPIVARVVENVTPLEYSPDTFVAGATIEPTATQDPLPIEENAVPVAIDDSAITDEEQSVTIDVTQNDSMVDGATLTSATQGSNGTTQIVGDQIVYTPNTDFEGVDTFQYTITDEDGETSTATVTVTVNDEGAPLAVDDGATTDEEQSVTIDVTQNDSMIDGATLTSATQGSNGTTQIVGDQIVYTPNTDFEGVDTFQYTITDEDGETSTATVTVTVNDEGAPVAVDDGATTDEEQSVTIDVTQNDSMIDGATLTSATQGSNGTTQIVGDQIVYTPNTDFEGVDTFQYTITDEDGETSTATVTVTVNDEGAPVAVDDGATTDEEQSVTIDVTQNDSMIDGATLTSATQGSNGTTQIVGDQIVYTPNTDFEGVDTFQYTITDEDGETSTATVTVTVNDEGAPVAVDDGATTDEEQSVTIDVTQNDSMIDGATLTSATQGSNGTTQIVGDQIVYTPNTDFEGVDTFQYTITDEDGETSTATVTVTVNDEGAPLAVDDGATTDEEQSVTIDVTQNDSMIDGATLTSATQGSNGTTQIVGDQIVYTPNTDFEGVDTFQYTITDEDGETSTATVTVTVNDEGAPVAVDDGATTDEEQSVTIDVTQNDSMIDGATLTSATQGSNGTTQIVGDQIVYTPNTDFEGVDTFQYTITDEDGETSTATVTVTVNDEGAPLAVDDGATTDEEQSVTIDVTQNDSMIDGATLTSATQGSNGTTQIVGDQIVYTPNTDFEGVDTFQYTITDEDGETSTATVTVTVNDEGAPVAVDDGATTDEEQSVTIDVTQNDSMIDGATLTSATQGSNGTTQIVGDQIVYTPNTDFEGVDTFQYTITDEDGETSTATVTVTVNDEGAPLAVDDGATTDEEQSVTIDVTQNDSMIDGATLTSATQGSNGTTQIVGDQIVYTPNTDFEGVDTFQYTITDEDGETSTATVTVTVNDEGAPVAVDDGATTDEEQSVTIDVTQNDSMIDGATLTSATQGSNGTTQIVGDQIVYTPNTDFEGVDTFQYTITDEDGETSTATVTVTVNDEGAPVAVDDGATTDEEQSVTIDVTQNDSMIDGATLTSATQGSNGTTQIVGDQIVYTPNTDFEGVDTFQYTITDEDGETSTATVTVTVNDEGAPVAVDDGATTDEEQSVTIDVTQNDSMIDGATLTSATQGSNGTTQIVGDQIVYTPNTDFEGVDTFQYTITDEDGETSTATVTVTVNDEGAPVAVDDGATTDEEQSVTIDVTQNDSMIDGATLTSATQGSNGTTQIVGDQIVYTPNTDFEGVDTFQYTITDEDGETSTATVTVTVNDEGAPVAVDDGATTDEEQSVTIDVTQNDSMIDGATLTSATQGSNGTTQIVGDQIVYTPNTDFEGVDTFQYTITDEDGETSTATVTVTVNDEGAPVAVDDGATTDEEQSVTIDVTQNDSMIDGATLTSATQGSNGTTQIVGDQIVYTPNTDFEGVDTFQYTITDEDGETSTATVTVNVNPVNDPPVISEGVFATVDEANLSDGTQPNVTLLSDTVGNYISISDVDGGDGYWIDGVAVVNPDGSLTGNSVTTDFGTLVFTSFDGSQLNYNYVLNDNAELDVLHYDDTVTVRTDDGTTGGVEVKIAQIGDDAPLSFTPDAVVIQSDGSSTDSDALNFAIADGADGLGSVTFKTDINGNLADAPELYFDSGNGIEQIDWVLSANNTIATGVVNGTEVITVSLDGSSDSYSAVSNADGTFLAPGETLPTVNSALTIANSKDYSGAVNIGGSNVDIVVSGTGNVNTTPQDIGIGNQWINSGEELTISFYTNSTLSGSSDTLSFDGTPEPVPIVNFELVVYQDSGDGADFDVYVIDSSNNETLYGSYQNILEGSSISISSSNVVTDIVAVKVVGTDDKFSIQAGDLDYLNPSDLSFDMSIVGMDADNDSIDSSITIGIDQDDVSGVLINGQIIDGFVGGLAYETSSGITGFTSANGGFNYQAGDTITFSIGNVILASIAADELTDAMSDGKLFLQEIAGVEQTNLNDEYVENMAVLLQTLDSNADAQDGIQITAEMHETFSDDSFDLSSISGQELQTILIDNGLTPVSEEDAMAHVQDMLEELANIDSSEFEEHVVDALVDQEGDLDLSNIIVTEVVTETVVQTEANDESAPIPVEDLIYEQEAGEFSEEGTASGTQVALDTGMSADTPVADDSVQQLIDDELETEYSDG
ncbi:hypothetical protein THMIRHAM_14810 [Thiomicrorhabdus immobilis]|uniref:Cadherin domain-containing protein n=1 Tax=Thiomicrorhabdus immobilis TaxID=2791037 RepID=A0ABN6CXK6_9GAMM|nr:Ig-like domain-containing protein [Thiomicrorhabdus immobilis]BCN93696.1 hypothetical protein THMIRHAM_14810 [Thiomicrorhabdus immobilis]